MTDHTPAPWLYRGKSGTVHKPCDTHPYGEQIFGFHDDEFDNRSPSEADLSLILAAPRLLAALEALCRQHPQGVFLEEYDPGYPEELEEAWAAIQEATGRPFDRWAK